MRTGINLSPASYYSPASIHCDRALGASVITSVYEGKGSIGSNGWPVGPAAYRQGVYLDTIPREYTFIVLKGAVSKLDVNQGANGGHVPVVITANRGTFTAVAGVSIGVSVTDPGETRWAIVPTDEIDRWKADSLAFSPSYLARYKGFSCARFMDWMRTNTNFTPLYVDPDMTSAAPLQNNVPLAMIPKFALEANVEPWIEIPIRASDATVRQIMKAVEPVRAAGKPVRVELGNEVWNDGFKAHAYAISSETALIATKTLPSVAKPNGMQWYGYRAAQVSKIIQDSGWSVGTDFRMVIGCFTGLPDQAAAVWDGVVAAGGNDHYFSEWSISSYVNGGVSTDVAKTLALVKAGDLDGAFNAILHGSPNSVDWIAKNLLPKHKAIADAHGLDPVVYEGGGSFRSIPNFSDASATMHLYDPTMTKAQVLDFFTKIASDPRAKGMTTANLSACAAAGVKLFCAYNDQGKWGENGLWGLFGSPGWDALMDWIANDQSGPAALLTAEIAEFRQKLDDLAARVAALR